MEEAHLVPLAACSAGRAINTGEVSSELLSLLLKKEEIQAAVATVQCFPVPEDSAVSSCSLRAVSFVLQRVTPNEAFCYGLSPGFHPHRIFPHSLFSEEHLKAYLNVSSAV